MRPPPPLVVAAALLAGIAGSTLFARGAFVAGGVLLAVSVVALRWPRSLWDAPEPPDLDRRTRMLLLLAVAAVAAFFRTYRMVPPGLWGDDAINGLLAYDILDGKITSPFQLVQHSASRFHALSNYFIAGSFWAFGADLWTLRLPGVVLNFLCVLLVYATFAPLFRARVALVAALFFAVSPQQLSQAKILFQDVAGEFSHLLAMCLLVRGLAGKRRWLIAAAGVPLALSLCTYHAYKLGPLIAAVYVVAVLLQRRDDRRTLVAWLGGFAVVFLIAFAPGLIGYAADPAALTGRIDGTSVLQPIEKTGNWWPLWDSLWRTLTIFHYQQGPVAYHWLGIGTAPALDPILAALVLHGVVQSLRRVREPRHLLLLAWFLIGILPGVLSSEAPRGYRILLATPPIFVWAALPVARLFAWAEIAPAARRAYAALAAVVLVVVPLIDFNHYFVRVYTHREYQWMQASRLVDMARTLRAYGPEWKGYLIATAFNSSHETLGLLKRMWGLDLRDATGLSDVMPWRGEGNLLLVFDPPASVMLPAVQQFYPTATEFTHSQERPRTWWFDGWLARPREEPRDMASYLPLSGTVLDRGRGLSAVYIGAEGVPSSTAHWDRLALPPPGERTNTAADATSVVATGSLDAPLTGAYRFRLVTNGEARVSLDGRPLLAPEQREADVELAQGMHTLGVSADLGPGSGFEVLWKPPGQTLQPVPPTQLYRGTAVRGWLAEWEAGSNRLVRLEPLPWYQFLNSPLERATRVRWRGRLRVPEGGRRLEIRQRGDMTLLVDGKPLPRNEPLAAGDHDIDLLLQGIDGSPQLVLQWAAPQARAQPIPPDAFLPPETSPPGAG